MSWIKGGLEQVADSGAQGSAEQLLSSQAPAGAVKVQLLFVFLTLSGAGCVVSSSGSLGI